jgi:hypothetical protein
MDAKAQKTRRTDPEEAHNVSKKVTLKEEEKESPTLESKGCPSPEVRGRNISEATSTKSQTGMWRTQYRTLGHHRADFYKCKQN